MQSKLPEKTFAVADCETDPFRHGYPVNPFVWGFFDGTLYKYFWGTDCNEQFLRFLENYTTPLCIYAHNGGKFDWYFLSKHFRGNIRIIGTRVVQAYIGKHEIRDSFANIPVPLRDFNGLDGKKKGEIDYQLMSSEKRNKLGNRRIILDYLKDDCLVLYDGIKRYRETFGNSLTMASASMKQLNVVSTGSDTGKIYEQLTPRQDFQIRPYYFGGRVECFSSGIQEGNLKMYDVTSMYPHVMAAYKHPIAASFVQEHGAACDITSETDFAHVICESHGALPVRGKAGLTFPHGVNEFFATGAELRKALSLGLVKIHKIHTTFTATEHFAFSDFVNQFFNLRQIANAQNDLMLKLFYKLVLNSAYGKFAQNPMEYKQLLALNEGEKPDGDLWNDPEICAIREHETADGFPCDCELCFKKRNAWSPVSETGTLSIWERPVANARKSFLNVATAASITGHSRSVLMDGLAGADKPLYCDTDCVITDGNFSGNVGTNLGQWKLECEGHTIALAGKKMYALFGQASTDPKVNSTRLEKYGDPYCIKLASKGVRLKAQDIVGVAQGQQFTHKQDAPVFKLDGRQITMTRTISNTARVERTFGHE